MLPEPTGSYHALGSGRRCGVVPFPVVLLLALAVVAPFGLVWVQHIHACRACSREKARDVQLRSVSDRTIGALRDGSSPSLAKTLDEISGVMVLDQVSYVVRDASWHIPVLHDVYAADSRNIILRPANETAFPPNVDSQWEAITNNAPDAIERTFIAMQESVPLQDGQFHGVLMGLQLKPERRTWHFVDACPSEMTFETDNKGFEGAVGMAGVDGRFFVLGLCEGNYCASGELGREAGNGRLVLMELDEGTGESNRFDNGVFVQTSTCVWRTVRIFAVPPIAQFEDYSDLAVRGDTIAITSQASSALYLGNMTLDDGLLNPDTFAVDSGSVLPFPTTDSCQTLYCNVEGIDFLADDTFVAGSDVSKPDQASRCAALSESIHVFNLYNSSTSE